MLLSTIMMLLFIILCFTSNNCIHSIWYEFEGFIQMSDNMSIYKYYTTYYCDTICRYRKNIMRIPLQNYYDTIMKSISQSYSRRIALWTLIGILSEYYCHTMWTPLEYSWDYISDTKSWYHDYGGVVEIFKKISV